MKLMCSVPLRSESITSTGIFASTAWCTTPARPVSESGQSVIPETPCATNDCTTSICAFKSSSLSGPFQMISTPVSCAAFTAPAWIDFQNSADAPLGMTAMRVVLPLAELPLHETVERDSARHAHANVRLCIVNTQYNGVDTAIQCRTLDILNLDPAHS